jgi:purine-nucleoside phosphorylase
MSTSSRVEQSVAFIQARWKRRPDAAIILGTGLGNAVAQMEMECALPFEHIPHFARSTALSHKGRLLCGRMRGVPVVAMEGRCHCYEGYTIEEIVLPVQTLAALGAETLVISNASGGLNPQFRSGQVMVVTDHIDLMGRWGQVVVGRQAGRGNGALAPRNRGSGMQVPSARRGAGFTSWCYDAMLAQEALALGRRQAGDARPGVYVALTGPNYETRAEYRFLRRIGGDAVGMSTVPEAITAAQLGMRVLALSIITNVATPDVPRRVDPQHVVALAAGAEPYLRGIIAGVITAAGGRNASAARRSLRGSRPCGTAKQVDRPR